MSGRKRLPPVRRSSWLQTPGSSLEEEDTPSSEEQQQSQESTDSPAVDSPASSQSTSIQGATYLEQVQLFTAGLLRRQPAARVQPPQTQAAASTAEQQQHEDGEEASSSGGDASSQDSKAGAARPEEADSKAALSTPSPLSIFDEHGTSKSQLSVGDSTIDYLAPVLQGDEITTELGQGWETALLEEPEEVPLPRTHSAEPATTELAPTLTSAITLSDDQHSGKTPKQAVATQPETKRHFGFAAKGVQGSEAATVRTSTGSVTENVAELVPTSGPKKGVQQIAQQTAQMSSIQTFSTLTSTSSSTYLGPPDPSLPVPTVPTYGDGQPTTQMDRPSGVMCPANCSDQRHGHPVMSLGDPSNFGPSSQLQPPYAQTIETPPVSGHSAFPGPSVAAYTEQSSLMPAETIPVLPVFTSWEESYTFLGSSDPGSGDVQQSQTPAAAARWQQLPATVTSSSLSSAGPYEQLHQTHTEPPTTQQGALQWPWQPHHLTPVSEPRQQISATSELPLSFEHLPQEVTWPEVPQFRQQAPTPRLIELLRQGPLIDRLWQQGPKPRLHQLQQQGPKPMLHQLQQQGPKPSLHQFQQQETALRLHQLQQQKAAPTLYQLMRQGSPPRKQQFLQQGPAPRLHQEHLWTRPSPRIQHQQLGDSLQFGAMPSIHQSTGFLQGPPQVGPSSEFLQAAEQAGPSMGYLHGPQQAGPSSGYLQAPQQAGPSSGYLKRPLQMVPLQGQECSPQAARGRATPTSLVYHPGQPQHARPFSAPPPRTRGTPPRKSQSRTMSAGNVGMEHHLPATLQASLLGVDTARYTPYSTAGRRHGHTSEASPERPTARSLTPAPRPPMPVQLWPFSAPQQGGEQHYQRRCASDSHLADFTHRAHHYLHPDDLVRKMEETYGFSRRGVHLSLCDSPLKEEVPDTSPRLLERVPGAVKLPEWDYYFMPGARPTTTPSTGLGHHAEQSSSEETPHGNIPGKVQMRHSWHGSGIPVCLSQETSVTGILPPAVKSEAVKEQLPTGTSPVERATDFPASTMSSHSTSEKLLQQEQEISSTSTSVPTAGPSGVVHKRQMGEEQFTYQRKRRKAEPTRIVKYDQHRTEGLGTSQHGGRIRAPPQRSQEGRGESPADTSLEVIPPTAEESNETEEENSEVQKLQNK